MELLQGKSPSEMFNFRSSSFKQTDLAKDKLGDNELIEIMLKEPRLIRRPVVRFSGQVYFGADKSVLAMIV